MSILTVFDFFQTSIQITSILSQIVMVIVLLYKLQFNGKNLLLDGNYRFLGGVYIDFLDHGVLQAFNVVLLCKRNYSNGEVFY